MIASRLFRSYNSWLAIAVVLNLYLARVTAHKFYAARYMPTHSLVKLLVWAVAANVAATVLVEVYRRHFGWTRRFGFIAGVDIATSLFVLLPMMALRVADYQHRLEVFGYAYAAFLFLKAAQLAWYGWSNARDAEEHPNRAYIFVAALVIYAAMTPWLALAQFPTGDEPAYLMLSYSLVHDHDFDLANNYAHKDYREFYPFPEIETHTVQTKSGQAMLWHDVGLSILLVPGYWLGARTGTMLELNLIAASVALAFYMLGRTLGVSARVSLLTAFLFSFTVPMSVYASQVFPELLGAALCIWGIVAFSYYLRRGNVVSLLVIGILIGMMPWICIRFWMLAIGLFLVTVARVIYTRKSTPKKCLKELGVLGVPVALLVALFSAFDIHFFSTPLPNAGYLAIAASYPQFFLHPLRGGFGMVMDRAVGLLPFSLIYILVIPGLIRMSRRGWMLAAIVSPSMFYFGFMCFSQIWTGAYCPQARYITGAAVPCVPAAALALANIRFRFIPWILALWSVIVAVLLTAVPILRYPPFPDNSPGTLNLYVAQRTGIHFGYAFPSLQLGRPHDWRLVALWCCAIAVFTFLVIGGRRHELHTRTPTQEVA